MTTINLKRLIKLARHLGEFHLIDVLFNEEKKYQSDNRGGNIEYFSWALWEMPTVFKEWRYSANGSPCFQSEQHIVPIMAAAKFFDLDVDEVFHLFVPDFQDEKYMGRELNQNSTPDDLVNNIYQFVQYKEFELAEAKLPVRIKNKSKEVKIKKLKFHEQLN